ncbi:lipase [Pseudoxanthomonas sp. SL93]|uniref:lipase family protein n=1 Tax=Pseudoxanthomonas sp. SL93 TaxID=2995142 RepID=UPI00226EEE22|nr:lipase [Pseudoxanthomonas sp. SL93]WAC61697.1 lipase [Pseudoxanthomonas sp. SL93]
MTISSRLYAGISESSYDKQRLPGIRLGGEEEEVILDGVKFKVLEHYDNPKTGYQGTIYQRADTGEIVVAHRGTEFDREPKQDGVADGAMVMARVNAQVPEALALTRRAMDRARSLADELGGMPEVTVTGHSLGGTLAQITAHRFNLRGEAFNPYGAASLKYGVADGGDRFINHVMAGDTVSAASPQYGQVRMYATPGEVSAVTVAGYGRFNPLPDNPLLATALTMGAARSHNMDNFLDIDSKGMPDRSVLSDPASRQLADDHAATFRAYRDDVRLMRGGMSMAGDASLNMAQRLVPVPESRSVSDGPSFRDQWADLPRQMKSGNSADQSVGVLRAPPAHAGPDELFQHLHASLTSGNQATIDRGLSNIAASDIGREFRDRINARADEREQRDAAAMAEAQQQEQQRATQIAPRSH